MSKVALVTGGVGGIGTEICKRLASDGRKVIAAYHPAEKEAAEKWLEERTAESMDCAIVECDVSDFASCEKMAAETGPVDVIVNCAGITRDAMMRKLSKDNWDAVINVNLNSVYNVSKQYFEGMAERGWGRIVNISSINGQKGQFGQTNYSAAKAGMHGFTMALAQEGARKGVTVNTVSPGYVETSMTAAIKQEVLDAIVSGIPMGRMGKPEEIASAVSYLSSEEAQFITGANLPVNGGMYMS